MILAPYKVLLAGATIFLALLACSLPFANPDITEPNSTPAVAASEIPTNGSAAEDINPFLPTATPTIDPEALQQMFTSTGKINASLDGEVKEWQTGILEVEGEQVLLSDWYRAPLQTISDLYYFEIYAIPPESLAVPAADEDAAPAGAAFTISFGAQAPQSNQTLTFTLPAGDELLGADIGYLVPQGDQFEAYRMTAGQLSLTLLLAEPGQPASLEGTFSGTLTYAGLLGDLEAELDPARTIAVSQGVIMIDALLYDPIFD